MYHLLEPQIILVYKFIITIIPSFVFSHVASFLEDIQPIHEQYL